MQDTAVQASRAVAGMRPGPELGALLAGIDLAQVPNDQMIEVLRAEARQLAHHQGRMFAALAEVGRCAPVHTPGVVERTAEPVVESIHEIATALRCTANAAFNDHDLAHQLRTRLPAVQAALLAGVIDRSKARLFVEHSRELTGRHVARVCTALLPVAPRLTTGQLADRLRRLLMALDPEALARRYRRAVRERQVFGYLDRDGTATLGASGLTPGEAAASSERVWVLARAIRAAGHPALLAQIRADLFVALLDGSLQQMSNVQIVAAMLARATTENAATEAAGQPPAAESSAAESSAVQSPGVDSPTGGPSAAAPPVAEASAAQPPAAQPPAAQSPAAGPPAVQPPAPGAPAAGAPAESPAEGLPVGRSPVGQPAHAPAVEPPPGGESGGESFGGESPGGESPDGESHAGGSGDAPLADEPWLGVEVRIRLSTLLGLDELPGEIPGWGPIPAAAARDTVARQRTSRWRFAITDSGGYLLLAGLTRARPPTTRTPPRQAMGGTVEVQVPLTSLRRLAAQPPPGAEQLITDLTAQWARRHELRATLRADPSARFPHAALRRHIEVRDRTCTFPGCRRPARATQQDHTHEVQSGGATVEENLGPLCVRHHALKSRGGWRLHQPWPGVFRWSGPLGGCYRTRGEPITPPLPDPEPSDPGPVESEEHHGFQFRDPDRPPDFEPTPPPSTHHHVIPPSTTMNRPSDHVSAPAAAA